VALVVNDFANCTTPQPRGHNARTPSLLTEQPT